MNSLKLFNMYFKYSLFNVARSKHFKCYVSS